ncbi:universal stress protein [Nocardia australiensis]|uniref:universal stress protein n=1 Tax=Nocardia australiensis TaxID=2887191 RepID=UPI001D13B402|nr:universal stress protein [Nocardia australiensis]
MPSETLAHAPINPPIVVAVDGSAISQHAAAWAAVDAAVHQCRLEIVMSFAVPFGFGPSVTVTQGDIDQLRGNAGRVLEEATGVARAAAPDATLAISTGVVDEPIIPALLTRSRQARMLVVGGRGFGAARRVLLGSVSAAITRHAQCPVTVVHMNSATDAITACKPVLVGVDGSRNSMAAIELAYDQASRREVGLIALHAWSDAIGYVAAAGWAGIRESEDALFAESLAGWTERHPEVSVRRVLVCDNPVRSLLEESENAQLVVVGSHGRGGFAGMLLGSTSTALLHSVECPITVVRGE